jgi:hypothetical protein
VLCRLIEKIDKTSASNKGGAPPYFSQAVIAYVKEKVSSKPNIFKGRIRRQVAKELLKAHKRELAEANLNSIGIRLPSKKTIQRAISKYYLLFALFYKTVNSITLFVWTTEKMGLKLMKAGNHNDRRVQATADMFSTVSQIGISYAIQGKNIDIKPEDLDPTIDISSDEDTATKERKDVQGLRIKPCMYFNLDAVCCGIGGEQNQKVFLSAETKNLLRKLKYTPTTNKKQGKRRFVKQVYVTSADGTVLCAFAIIKDNSVKEIQELFPENNPTGPNFYIIFVPNKKPEKVIIVDKFIDLLS